MRTPPLLWFLATSALVTALASGACDPPWFQIDDNCYYFSPNDNSEQVLSWHQSQSWCLQNGAQLATIEDVEERSMLTNKTEEGPYNGALWIGLTKLIDHVGYKWVDGSISEFRDWAVGEPKDDKTGLCAYQLAHAKQDCFTYDPGYSTIIGLFDRPNDQNRTHTFYFGYMMEHFPDDQKGSAECQARCSVEPECFSYTFISYSYTINGTWYGECMGRSDEYDVKVEDPWSISGERYTCGESGYWHVANCGEKRGFVCKRKTADIVTPGTTGPPTPTVPGFCPGGYFEAGGNKCFKMAEQSAQEGVTWDVAYDVCSTGPGIAPNLAHIESDYENAVITMHLQEHYWGFWIGLKVSDSFDDQWVWSDNREVGYFNWAVGKPTGSGKCGELWTNPPPPGKWNNLDCTYKRGYICQTFKDASSIISTPPTTIAHSCRSGYFNYGGICYQKISASSWSLARSSCEADGATLATVHSEAQNAALLVFGNDATPFWIGYYKGTDGVWVWTDGWPTVYSNWESEGAPEGGCTSFQASGKWKDDDCNSNLNAICMISTATPPTSPAPAEGACPTNWVEYGSYCYFVGSEYQNWEMAKASCNSKAGYFSEGTLASIHSSPENQFVYEYLKSAAASEAWIGLYKDDQDLPYKWADGSEVQYITWAPGEPNDRNGSQKCINMYVNMWPGLWNDHTCQSSLRYVCKAPKVPEPSTPYVPPGIPNCPTGCKWKAKGLYCYYLELNQHVSFNEAQETCVHLGGRYSRLAVILDPYTNIDIVDLIRAETSYLVKSWIGLSRRDLDSAFRWLDGSPLNFTNWTPGEPNNMGEEHCGELWSDSGTWNDMNCETNRLNYICQVKREDLPSPPPEQVAEPVETGITLSSGELAGIVIGTMLGMVVLFAVGLLLYSHCTGRSFSSSSKRMDEMETASTVSLPYESSSTNSRA